MYDAGELVNGRGDSFRQRPCDTCSAEDDRHQQNNHDSDCNGEDMTDFLPHLGKSLKVGSGTREIGLTL